MYPVQMARLVEACIAFTAEQLVPLAEVAAAEMLCLEATLLHRIAEVGSSKLFTCTIASWTQQDSPGTGMAGHGTHCTFQDFKESSFQDACSDLGVQHMSSMTLLHLELSDMQHFSSDISKW